MADDTEPSENDFSPIRPSCLRDDAVVVLKQLRAAGYEAYFAGGCVRDLLLRIEPKDYDVATSAPPNVVRSLFPRTQAVGAAFGVVLVRHGMSVIEVATFRSDGQYTDGRHPTSVRFTTAEEDAQRRDFTINGLFLDPLTDRVVDYVGGQADLESRVLRAIGDPAMRFAEDHLRLLRAVRFAARFDLLIEPSTADAIAKEAPMLKRISPERIADELRRMWTPPTRIAAWALLWRYGLIGQIFRQLSGAAATRPPAQSLFVALSPGMTVPFPLALLAATIDYRPGKVIDALQSKSIKQTIRALREGLKISNAESDAIEGSAAGAVAMLGESLPPLAQRRRMMGTATAPLTMDLLQAIVGTGQHIERIRTVMPQLRLLIGTDVTPTPLITGDDLQAMGLRPGPMFKRILDHVYDAQLEGTIADVDAAKVLVRSISS